MKPPRQNVGKAGTKGTKPLPDGAGIAVRPFQIHLFNAAFDAPHDLGEILTPEQMAAKVPRGGRWKEMTLDAAADKALAALIGYGPKELAPHFDTARLLAKGLARLRDFAIAGDAAAMRVFGSVLSQAVADLGEMARRKKPEVVREWSRKQNVVPVLTGKNKGHRTQLAADLDAFGVGDATPYRVNPQGKKVPVISTPANALAGHLCKHLADTKAKFRLLKRPVPPWARLASKLPPLSKAVWERWGDAAWACLLDATDRHPEENASLAPLGRKAKDKHDRERKDAAERERVKRRAGYLPSAARRLQNETAQGSRTLAGNVRAEIRQTLREAICNLASVSPAPYSE